MSLYRGLARETLPLLVEGIMISKMLSSVHGRVGRSTSLAQVWLRKEVAQRNEIREVVVVERCV